MTGQDPPATGLPIEDVVGEVRAALAHRGLVVVEAPPGAGKSTVLPLRLLGEPWVGEGRIVLLEPRRLAARATARRLAALLGQEVGTTVGYRTRDERVVGPAMRLEVVTEGILVRRLQDDPTLAGISAVLLDEVHERHLTTDLSLALAADVRRSIRPDLRIGLLSATIDADALADRLGQDRAAPIVRSSGRLHEVRTVWLGAPTGRTRLEDAMARAVGRALRECPEGDLLVFLPGMAEIDRLVGVLRAGDLGPTPVDVVALAGSLSATDQDRALAPAPAGRRRIVVSTDLAESSLTVPGVRVVVDAGLVRRPRYDAASGRTRLITAPASRAAAAQRAGRAGRVAPGVVYRLWDEAEHLRRDAHPTPEIAAADLTGLQLELAVWGTSADAVPLPDAPPAAAWAAAATLLETLGALDPSGRPTPLGRSLVSLPLHPRLGAMVRHGIEIGHGWTAVVVAAVLDEADVASGPRQDRHADLADRVRAVAGEGAVEAVSRERVRIAARRARDLGRRVGVRAGPLAIDAIGTLVAIAYPDRLAQQSGRGRFRLLGGGAGRVADADPLAGEAFLAVADVDASEGDGRIRLAAAITRPEVEAVAGPVEVERSVIWDDARQDVRGRERRRIGALVLDERDAPAEPGPEVVALLLAAVRGSGGALLPWTPSSRGLQARLAFVRSVEGDRWPDLSDAALLVDLEDWLGPALSGAAGARALGRVDLLRLLRHRIPHGLVGELERLTPARLALANGRSLAIAYDATGPTASARAEDLFGVTVHPAVLGGRVPVVITVQSPANRPMQVTADLPGFWAGSWAQVRREMAGRYPRHPWPQDPGTAVPRPPRRARPR